MYEEEIKAQKWAVSDNLKVEHENSTGTPLLEQEGSILVLRAGIEDESKEEVLVEAGHQPFITELAKSEYFELREVTLSSHERNEGYVLYVKGVLERNGLTIRKKKAVFSEEEKKLRADRARENFTKKD